MLAILAVIAKQERIRISKTTLAGLKRARVEGKRLGRSAKAFDLKQARRMRNRGLSFRQIGSRLGVSEALCRVA